MSAIGNRPARWGLVLGVLPLLVSGPAATSAEGAVPGASQAKLYFPPPGGEWKTVEPADAGWSAEGLDAVLAYAREQGSSGMVILDRGRLLVEGHWDVLSDGDDLGRYESLVAGRTDDGRTVEDVASVQKSVVSFLAGVARGRDLLDFQAPVSRYLGAGWSRATADQESAIRVWHLMAMASGLDTDRTYEAPAGEKWMYNTNVYSLMVPVLEAVSGSTIDEITSRWLTGPIGMGDSEWGPRPWLEGREDANRIGFQTTARDLARFGLLILAEGRWDGEDLLGDPRYFDDAFSPSQPHNDAYGLLWWLNGGSKLMFGRSGEVHERSLIPSAPADLVAAQGAMGRKVYIVPSLGLVLTRLGAAPEEAFNNELWRLLLAARAE